MPSTVVTAAQHAWLVKAPRYRSLDMWRGIACLMMVVFHTTMQITEATHNASPAADSLTWLGQCLVMATARSWIGVPIFFVISGYCIMATLDSGRRRQRSFGEYLSRRFRRIYPPYWIALAVAVVAIWLFEFAGADGLFADGRFTVPLPWEMTAGQWFGNLTLTETWRPLVTDEPMSQLLPNTWTLCYEEQFYFAAGLLLWFAPRRIFIFLAIFTVGTFAAKVVAHKLGVSLFGTFLDGRWLLIAAGIAVYYQINYAGCWTGRAIHLALLLGMATANLGPADMADWEPTNDLERFAGFGFALLISLTYGWDKAIMATRAAKLFAAVGGISYSVYLIHPLIAKGLSYGLFRAGNQNPWFTLLVIVPCSLACSLLVANVFYALVERHFQNSTGEKDEASSTTVKAKQSASPKLRTAPLTAGLEPQPALWPDLPTTAAEAARQDWQEPAAAGNERRDER